MTFFSDWLRDNWNNLVDRVSLKQYLKVKQEYLIETNNEIDLSSLTTKGECFSVEDNFTLFIVEKWLYRQAAVHEPNLKSFFKNHMYARTALIYKFLLNNKSNLFFDYDLSKNCHVPNYKVSDQFFAYWCNFSERKDIALYLLKEADENSPYNFVIFMGLRRLGLRDEANKVGKKIDFKIDDYSPRISTNTCSLLRYCSPYESLDLIKKAGFNTFDYSMEILSDLFTADDYLLRAQELKKYADSIELCCNQTHSIFPVWHISLKKEDIEKRVIYTKRILEISKILGAKNCVVHPINDFNERQNCDYYKQYLPLAHELDINIATENMFNCDENAKPILAACSNHNNFLALMKLVHDDHFVACVDFGHAEMEGLNTSAVDMIENLGSFVKCVHIHDNDLRYDRHGLPLSENIDFDLILDSLARTNYQGDITLECDGFINRMPRELHLECLKLMYNIGSYLKEELLIRRKATCLKK